MVPVADSVYSYSYITMGEFFACSSVSVSVSCTGLMILVKLFQVGF